MSAQLEYQKFIEGKIAVGQAGFEVELDDVDGSLFPHQQDAVVWALRKGRALIAMSFGLGKTAQQVEIARHVHQRTGKLFLVIAPLGVRHQFVQEDGGAWACAFSMCARMRRCGRRIPFLITNYERVRDGQIDPLEHDFGGVSLDEGSILRGLGTKTSERFKQVLTHIPYRFVCTATPAPNQFRELIYYAQFWE